MSSILLYPLMLPEAQESEAPDEARIKWFNSPVHFHKGNLSEIRQYIPDFERRSFGLTQPDNKSARLNERLDTIVRRPSRDDQTYVPVAVVSKEYSLVQHTMVLDQVITALENAKILAPSVTAKVGLTQYGERMALSVYLPDNFSFNSGDGDPMALRLECFNSVDGSCRFRALMVGFGLSAATVLFLG